MDPAEKNFHDVAYSHTSRLTGDGRFALELDGFPLKGVRRVEVIDRVGEPITLVVELIVGSVNKPESVNVDFKVEHARLAAIYGWTPDVLRRMAPDAIEFFLENAPKG